MNESFSSGEEKSREGDREQLSLVRVKFCVDLVKDLGPTIMTADLSVFEFGKI